MKTDINNFKFDSKRLIETVNKMMGDSYKKKEVLKLLDPVIKKARKREANARWRAKNPDYQRKYRERKRAETEAKQC